MLVQSTFQETTPLLGPIRDQEVITDVDISRHNQIYDRFPTNKKRIIVCLVSSIGLTPPLVFGTIVPSILQIAADLDTSPEIIGLAISISMWTTALETPIWASYSAFYGRRPVYLFGLPFLALGSIGVGCSQSVTELMLWRVVQAFGTVSGVSMGSAVIGDIYKLEERGTAMGAFYSVSVTVRK